MCIALGVRISASVDFHCEEYLENVGIEIFCTFVLFLVLFDVYKCSFSFNN